MTDEQRTLFEDLFSQYGSVANSCNRTIYVYGQNPETEDSISELAKADKRICDKITELERTIEQLKAYRIAIAERYNYLATAPTTPVVKLKRQKLYYDKHVYYYIEHYSRDLNTNKDTLLESIKYTGTERKKAIEDFENYVSAHPGIISIKDIEKSRWER